MANVGRLLVSQTILLASSIFCGLCEEAWVVRISLQKSQFEKNVCSSESDVIQFCSFRLKQVLQELNFQRFQGHCLIRIYIKKRWKSQTLY